VYRVAQIRGAQAYTSFLVHRHWSGEHHRVVQGINLVTLLWRDGTDTIPCDYRLYDKPVDGLTTMPIFGRWSPLPRRAASAPAGSVRQLVEQFGAPEDASARWLALVHAPQAYVKTCRLCCAGESVS
jgi:hypothetical protein